MTAILLLACRSPEPGDTTNPAPTETGGTGSPAPIDVAIAGVADPRFVTREHFLASGEMQLSGEPLAEAMGRDLAGYNRNFLPTDLYYDPDGMGGVIDLAGFSTGIESYEYSKQPMNAVALELGAGTSLVWGPLLGGLDPLASRIGAVARATDAWGRYVFPPDAYPDTQLGWPGLWPTVHPFVDFDPAIDPTHAQSFTCFVTSDDPEGGLGCADYECSADTLHLRDRAAQVNPRISPGADGFSAWKYALWVVNYTELLHDVHGGFVTEVAEADLPAVGQVGNEVVGAEDGDERDPGTFLGSSNLEGFQAAMFLDELDNRAEDWLLHLSTADGVHLDGFADLAAAAAYGHQSPVRWFPSTIRVDESDDPSGFPAPSYALESADSDLLDLAGLAMGYAEAYALTDPDNAGIGGAVTVRPWFDGDPYPADDGLADGEATLHDRALAMIRVAVVDLDRLHYDPVAGALADDVAMDGATPTRGTTASTVDAAYAILALRTVSRSLSSQLELYSNNLPDQAVGVTPLDRLPLGLPADPDATFSARAHDLLVAEADLLYDHLTDESGRAWSAWDLVAGAPTSEDDLLDPHTAAVRGLFAAYLATGDTRYRERAVAVFDRAEATFYDPEARIWSRVPAPVDEVTWDPLGFALLQSALRDVYLLVATRPGGEGRAAGIEAHLGRLDKLVLNGWNDRDFDEVVDWPDECVDVEDGLPRGGLQRGERTLSGEIGYQEQALRPGQPFTPTSDREHDCVPEIDDAHAPAALAASLTLTVER
jgi:hypothetical protein